MPNSQLITYTFCTSKLKNEDVYVSGFVEVHWSPTCRCTQERQTYEMATSEWSPRYVYPDKCMRCCYHVMNLTTQNGYSNEITCKNCGCCAPQLIPKLKSSSLTEVATASTRVSAMLYPCWCFRCLGTRGTTCTAWWPAVLQRDSVFMMWRLRN